MPELNKPYILIVDDNPFSRELVSEVAKSVGYVVKEAKDGNEALREVSSTLFNLVILDLLMPGMDGFQAAKKIREMGSNVPIVASSALALKQDQQRSLDAGCNHFLPKPLDNNELRAILKKYLNSTPNTEEIILSNSNNSSMIIQENPLNQGDIVLVEEEKQNRKEYTHLLTKAGFHVRAYQSGSEASGYIQNSENKIDIIISNIFTSGIDGLGLLNIVKRQSPQTLVFLYTPSYDAPTFQYAVHQKVDGIIPQDQFKATGLDIIKSALSQTEKKDSRAFEATTTSLVRKAQDSLIHRGCRHRCSYLDVAYKPLQAAGGDMMRCHKFGSNQGCGVMLADVAGHDVTASYTSATFTGILMSVWDKCKNPLELIKRSNQELLKVGNTNSHICATAMAWDSESGHIEIASAGNPGGLLVTIGSDKAASYESFKGGGMVLGALETNDLFVHDSGDLDENTYLFMFSDGIEKQDIIDVIENHPELLDPSELKPVCQNLLDAILKTKTQDDDMILLCFRRKKKSEIPIFQSRFLSTYKDVDKACIWLDQQLCTGTIPRGNDLDLILLAAREAFLNAVEHGNNHRKDQYFKVAVFLKDLELKISISDNGKGLRLKKHLCNPDDLTLTQVGKRGLSFMADTAHKIEVENNTISLIFVASPNE